MPFDSELNLFFDLLVQESFQIDDKFPVAKLIPSYIHEDDHDDHQIYQEVVSAIPLESLSMVSHPLKLVQALDPPPDVEHVNA